MTSKPWSEVERLYHAVLGQPENQRSAFLASACGADLALRREVDSLLAHTDPTHDVFEHGAMAAAAQLVSHPATTLMVGRRVRAYELVALIGAGGMGEVYRARDTRLGRDVAIKLLPPAFKRDPERIARFEREAQMLAAMKHPHIGAIYGLEDADDSTALVMELVEGEDLSRRLQRGPLPLDQALAFAQQIADALDAAHEQGIIHRDLKPANVRIQPDGTAKVLDFGLAKPVAPATDAPTLTALSRRPDAVIGTPAYMSPEQARGEPVGREADIWALGVVLYELMTGVSPFARPSTTETLASVLTTAPDESLLPADTPANVQRLLRRCFEKDPKRRWRHMGDVRIELEEAIAARAAGSSPSAIVPAVQVQAALRSAQQWRWLAVTSLVVGVGVAAAAWWALGSRPIQGRPVIRFALPSGGENFPAGRYNLAVSPDGSRLVHASARGFTVRARDRLSASVLNAVVTFPSAPVFSPDGQWIAYADTPVLKKIPATGGVPIELAETGQGATVDWAPEGILFADMRGLFLLEGERGTPKPLALRLDAGEQATSPQMLPGGRAVLYTVIPSRSIVVPNARTTPGVRVEVLEIDSGKRTALIQGGSHGRYVPTGHLIYLAQGILHAVGFDASALELRGNPVEMVGEQVSEFAVSAEGTLVYAPSIATANTMLTWVDRSGREEPVGAPPHRYLYPRLSPDGARVALDVFDGPDRDIWIWDLRRKTLERFTIDPAGNPLVAWSRDGRRLMFGSDRFGPTNLFWQAADGSGEAERLLVSDRLQMPVSVAPDGRLLFSEEVQGQGRNIHALSLDETRRVEVLVRGPANELNGEVSPDGKWLAYDSNESGQFEIYVRPYPKVADGRWKVSLHGGRQPLWSRDGRELFFRDFSGAIMSAAVTLTQVFVPGEVTKIIDGGRYLGGGPTGSGRTYDLSLDGHRFLMVEHAESNADAVGLVVVVNWDEELKRQLGPR